MSLVWPESPKPEGERKDLNEIIMLDVNQLEELKPRPNRKGIVQALSQFDISKIINEVFYKAEKNNEKAFTYFIAIGTSLEKVTDYIRTQYYITTNSTGDSNFFEFNQTMKAKNSYDIEINFGVSHTNLHIRNIWINMVYYNCTKDPSVIFPIDSYIYDSHEGSMKKHKIKMYHKTENINSSNFSNLKKIDRDIISTIHYNVQMKLLESGAQYYDYDLFREFHLTADF